MQLRMIFAFLICMSLQALAEESCHWVSAGTCQKNVSPGRCVDCRHNSLCCCESPLESTMPNEAEVLLKNNWNPKDHLYLNGSIAEILWNSGGGQAGIWGGTGEFRGPRILKREITGEFKCMHQEMSNKYNCDITKISANTAKILYAAIEPTQCDSSKKKELGPLKCSSEECNFVESAPNPNKPASDPPAESKARQ